MMDQGTTSNHLDSVAMGVHGGIEAAGLSNVGRSRRGNEDAFLIATLQRSLIVHDDACDPWGWHGERGLVDGRRRHGRRRRR
jgi:hypothetical protein